MEIVNEVMVRGGGMEKMLDEPTSMAAKRERLQRSVGLLQESKHIIQQVMDGIPVIGDYNQSNSIVAHNCIGPLTTALYDSAVVGGIELTSCSSI
ncbi:hypothetical protein L1887_39375 [Cichorium endivia]|nr:hypothetical protein L1887_39375 [Cichorium endivia]